MPLRRFELERFFAEFEFHVEHMLCGSDCEPLTIDEILRLEPGASERFGALGLGYTETQGSLTLREQIARIYETIGPEQVIVHAGAEEGILLFMQAALASGDHVVVHRPCYQSLFEIAQFMGCEVSSWLAREENAWALDLDELVPLLRPNTRAIVLNVPHNPTGYLMDRSDYDRLHEIVRQRGLLLFSDEVYRECEHRPTDRLPAACDVGPHAVSLGVMSKTYGLAGLRLGWTATKNREVHQRISELKDYTTICTSAPSEFLAEIALRHREQLVARNLEVITANLGLLDGLFERHAEILRWVRPRAGTIGFPKLLVGELERFVQRILRERNVLLLPGSVFEDGDNHFRLGFGRADMSEGLRELDQFLAGLRV